MWQHEAACEIVTRNRHVEAIRDFLRAAGGPEGLPVTHVAKGQSKADAVLRGVEAGAPVVFVDDSIAELCTTRLEAERNVFRVLFVRLL